MALIGSGNYEKIYNFLKAQGFTDAGAVGTMANIKAESNGQPGNLQNTCEKKLGMTDAEYVAAVDAGTYTNFATDGAGFGICQWTFHTRKEALLGYVKKMAVSVADLEGQLCFMAYEMATNYKTLWNLLKTTTSFDEASDAVMTQYERPADQSDAAKAKRRAYAKEFWDVHVAAAAKKSVDELAQEVIAGKWGNGTTRKERLTTAGYNYDEVQARVNEIMAAKALTDLEKVAKAVIRGDYGNGAARKKALEAEGWDYATVQTLVNKLLKN